MDYFIEFFSNLSSAGWGNSAYEILFYLSIIFIIFKEKDKWKRTAFGWYPILIMIGIFNPITVTLATRIFGTYQLVAYYCRLFLLMPIVFCIVYGMILNLKECKDVKKFCFAMTLLAIIVVSGKCVYSEDWILKAENFNKVPDDVIELSSLLNSEVTVMVPNDLTSYVRQYDPRIHLVYGRYAAGDEIAMQVSSETPDVGFIIEYGKEHNCDYVVCINSQSIIDGFMENDCVVYGFTDNYVIIQL